MGWVSKLEDIVERANESIHMSEREVANPPAEVWSAIRLLGDKQRKLETLHSEFRSEVKGLDEYIDLATDPRIDLAVELKELRERNALLAEENTRMQLRIQEQQQRLESEDRLRKKAEREERERKDAQRQVKQLTKSAKAYRRGR